MIEVAFSERGTSHFLAILGVKCRMSWRQNVTFFVVKNLQSWQLALTARMRYKECTKYMDKIHGQNTEKSRNKHAIGETQKIKWKHGVH